MTRPSVEDCDWVEAFAYAGGPDAHCGAPNVINLDVDAAARSGVRFGIGDVAEFEGWSEGANDGPSWIVWGRLKSGLFFYLSAGCDYTGWDCQAGGTAWVSSDREAVWSQIPEDDRERMAEVAS